MSARFVDTDSLRSVELNSTGPAQTPFNSQFWLGGLQTIQNTTFVPLGNDWMNRVFQEAYTGDLAQLTFSQMRVYTTTANNYIYENGQQIPLRIGANVVGRVNLPANLRQLTGQAELVIYGPVRFESIDRNTELVTAPQFPLTLGYLTIQDVYLQIITTRDGVASDVFPCLAGKYTLFGTPLPIQSWLPTDDGLLSFNLDTTQAPVQADLGLLAPVVNGRGEYLTSLDPASREMLAQVKQYRLAKLNIMYDVANPAIVAVSFKVSVLNEISIRATAGAHSSDLVLAGIRLSWMVGLPETDHAVSIHGKGKARFLNFEWDVTLEFLPELCLKLWSTAISGYSLQTWLFTVGQRTPVAVRQYTGCLFCVYANRWEVFAGDEGEDFQRWVIA